LGALDLSLESHLRSLQSFVELSDAQQEGIVTLVEILNQLHQIFWGRLGGRCGLHRAICCGWRRQTIDLS
jgi:hypothetical protein